jgi:hypothetical protein
MLGDERLDAHGGDTPQPARQPPQMSQLPNKRTRSRFVTSRFKGFDDGFDPATLPQSSKMLEELQKESLSESHECANEEPVRAASSLLSCRISFVDGCRDWVNVV